MPNIKANPDLQNDDEARKIQFRQTQTEDIPTIEEIYSHARTVMAATGNPHQWVDGHPQQSLLVDDIQKQISYVGVIDDRIEAVFVLLREGDSDYDRIFDGQWLNDDPYLALHRLASAGNIPGLTRAIFDWCAKICPNIRIDTHRDNRVMQHVLAKNGFAYCGLIYLKSGAERLAYQRVGKK
jgi:hypothetical protein